jgi:hypothetical protein
MKTLVIIFSVVGLMTLNSCKQESGAQAMLENTETRSEIMKAIADNHDFMTEFMENMQGNEYAMQLMQGNKEMMSNMMMGEGKQMMMKDMMSNKEMMNSMMSEMMGTMMNMMHEKGLMSDECMKSCMENMNSKGMNMGDMHN